MSKFSNVIFRRGRFACAPVTEYFTEFVVVFISSLHAYSVIMAWRRGILFPHLYILVTSPTCHLPLSSLHLFVTLPLVNSLPCHFTSLSPHPLSIHLLVTSPPCHFTSLSPHLTLLFHLFVTSSLFTSLPCHFTPCHFSSLPLHLLFTSPHCHFTPFHFTCMPFTSLPLHLPLTLPHFHFTPCHFTLLLNLLVNSPLCQFTICHFTFLPLHPSSLHLLVTSDGPNFYFLACYLRTLSGFEFRLYGVCVVWMDGYGTIVDWYRQGKSNAPRIQICPSATFSTTDLSHGLPYIETASPLGETKTNARSTTHTFLIPCCVTSVV